jgi:hypothetical protein
MLKSNMSLNRQDQSLKTNQETARGPFARLRDNRMPICAVKDSKVQQVY